MSAAYALNNLDAYTPPNCSRCGFPAKNSWVDISRVEDPVPMVMPGRHWCETPGCVDDKGRNTVG